MARPRKSRRLSKEERREQLLTAALRVFGRHGYHGTRVETIITAAGVARGTFYLYFEDKRALFAALMDGWHSVVLGMFDDVEAKLAQAETHEEAWQVYRDMGTGLAWVGLANRDEILLAFRESRTSTEAGASLVTWLMR